MADTDPIENLIPDDPGLDAEDEFLALDELDEDEPLLPEEDPAPFGRTWAFDYIAQRFVTGKGRGPLEVRGLHALHVWIEKTLRTDQGAHPVYSEEYGIEKPYELIGHQQDVDVARLEGRLREALTYHPRIADVDDVEAEGDEDSGALLVSFTVILDDDEELTIDNVALA